MKKNITLLLAVLLVAGILFGVWHITRPETIPGQKTLSIEVTHGDSSTRRFDIETDAEYLADALIENGIVADNQSTYGLYILTADGETADEIEQEWWCITRGGERLSTGAGETPIADGEQYELTFTVGYDF